ncbi:molybdopterin-dependent oxidoreductase [Nannocystis exedens]|nr:molybdopterin-dependent oxidoreductase [Nannocystis exedens]
MLRPALALAAVLAASACSATPPAGALEVQTGSRSESLAAARLAELPQIEVAVGDKRYAGPRLREALLAAGVASGVDVEVIAADGYKQTVSAATVGRDDVIVALGLPPDEGPLRLIVPGSPGLSIRQVIAARAVPAAVP